ncbi:MAG: hypothetical protein R3330_00430 [Saprospiraceae bacterium]|nr:hypothetical protein [Saprospiraceae bacterium]
MKFISGIKSISTGVLGMREEDLIHFSPTERLVWESDMEDAEIQQTWFPDVTRRSYESFKGRLRDRIYDMILTTGPRNATSFQKIYLRHVKKMAVIHTLIRLGARRYANQLAIRLVHTAIRYDFTPMVVELARILVYHYSHTVRNQARTDEYYRLSLKYLQHYQHEILAEKAYGDIMYYYGGRKHHGPQVREIITKWLTRLQSLRAETNTTGFCLRYFLVAYIDKMSQHRIDDAMAVIREALDYFNALDYDHAIPKVMFKNMLVQCHLLQGDLYSARVLLEENARTPNGRNLTWANNKEMLIRTAIAGKEYDLARQVVKELNKWSVSPVGNKRTRDRVRLYDVYLGLATGQLHKRMQKVLNTGLQQYSPDAKALDASMLIAELVYHTMRDGSTDFILMWHEKISLYIKRHLKSPRSRARIFLRLLLSLPRLKYDIAQYRRISEKYLAKLRDLPRSASEDAEEVEIVPYEHLWEVVCGHVGVVPQTPASVTT